MARVSGSGLLRLSDAQRMVPGQAQSKAAGAATTGRNYRLKPPRQYKTGSAGPTTQGSGLMDLSGRLKISEARPRPAPAPQRPAASPQAGLDAQEQARRAQQVAIQAAAAQAAALEAQASAALSDAGRQSPRQSAESSDTAVLSGVRQSLVQVMSLYTVVFGVSWVLTSVLGWGAGELSLSSGEPMLYARAGVMLVAAVLGVVFWRQESPRALGFEIRPLALGGALMAAAFLGMLTSVVARFDVAAGASTPVLVGLLVLRAAAETVFFQGLITRTLLDELKNPGVAVGISAVLYGLYALTYAPIAAADGGASLYAVAVYTFGGGFPFALIFFGTRCLPAVFVCQLLIMLCAL